MWDMPMIPRMDAGLHFKMSNIEQQHFMTEINLTLNVALIVRLVQFYFDGYSQACPVLLWWYWSGLLSVTLSSPVLLWWYWVRLAQSYFGGIGQACSVLLWWYWSGLSSFTFQLIKAQYNYFHFGSVLKVKANYEQSYTNHKINITALEGFEQKSNVWKVLSEVEWFSVQCH